MLYDTKIHNEEPILLICLRWLVEGVILIGFLCSILLATIIVAAWTGVI